MTTCKSALAIVFLLLMTFSPATTSAQTTAVLTASQSQGQCCVCSTSTGSIFKVPAQGSCSIACAASGGTATGSTTPCSQGGGSPSYPPAKYDGPTQCMKSIDGGNCRGNNWCHCGVVRVTAVMDEGIEYPAENAKTWEPVKIYVGQTLKFHGIIHHFGGTESGSMRVALQKSASIEISGPDGKHLLEISADETPEKNMLPHPPIQYFAQFASYTFDKPGQYRVAVHVWGAFKWNGDDGSCSYECENGPSTLAAIRTDGENWALFVVVDTNPDLNKPKR